MARIIDVIEFLDETGREIVHREPEGGPGDIRLGSQLIVRESQTAVFFRDGRALDVFAPGRHTLTTYNLPILSGLIGLATNGRTPFPAEVVFVNMRQFLDQKWGTSEPITLRDPEFGMARLRAFGSYTFQVANPSLLVNEIVGQQGMFSTNDIQNYLRGIVIQRFTDVLGAQKRALLDLASEYSEIALSVKSQLDSDFAALGLTLTALYVQSISPTEETAKAIDERASMGAIGNLDAYMKFKAARALGDAANNPNSGANQGVGLGAGIGLGAGLAGMLGQAFGGGQQQPQQPQQPAPPAAAPAAAPAAGGALTAAQIHQAIDNLDLRFSTGEISEDAYNRLLQKWQDRLKEMGG